MSGRHQPLNGADSAASLRDSMATVSIGEAVRVHMREERARYRYKVARWNHVHKVRGNPDMHFRVALVRRAEWNVLRQIIDAPRPKVAA